jgi:hypothetical protein
VLGSPAIITFVTDHPAVLNVSADPVNNVAWDAVGWLAGYSRFAFVRVNPQGTVWVSDLKPDESQHALAFVVRYFYSYSHVLVLAMFWSSS